jgi:DNA-binding beta-propeller fold protein YncE
MTDLEVGQRPATAPEADLAEATTEAGPDATQAVLAAPPGEPPAVLLPDGRATDEPLPETAPDAEAEGDDTGDAAGGTTPTEPIASRRGRRRRIALLVILAVAATGLVLFSAWYLITRKPISELPLPGLTTEAVPSYSFSVYGMVAPTGIAVTPDGGRIYVTQTEGDPRVLVFDGKGNPIGTLDPPATTGPDHVPVYIAIDPTNSDVYVSDRPTGSIFVYAADGALLRVFQPGKSLDGWQPLGLGFDRRGHLYVTDVSGPFNSIHEFDAEGALVRTIGKQGQFSFPNGVVVDADGNLYVTDSNNGRLVVLDPSGQERAIVRRGASAGDLGLPRGAAIDDSGRVYVVDTSGQSVKLYHVIGAEAAPPAYIGQFGTLGTDDGAFQYPNGVAVDGRARVYITDWRNNRVQVWTY